MMEKLFCHQKLGYDTKHCVHIYHMATDIRLEVSKVNRSEHSCNYSKLGMGKNVFVNIFMFPHMSKTLFSIRRALLA